VIVDIVPTRAHLQTYAPSKAGARPVIKATPSSTDNPRKEGGMSDSVALRAERDHIEAALDAALAETFPASDPVAITGATIARPLPPE
jgi:hypothetical protein